MARRYCDRRTCLGLVFRAFIGCLVGTITSIAMDAAEAGPEFFRGLNLNGPAVTIDGNQWEGKSSHRYICSDKAFENQSVSLIPATDVERTQMIRSSRWGGNRITLTEIPTGTYSLFLYVWEDNDSEQYSISVNGQQVVARYNSGTKGHWEKLGPWYVSPRNNELVVTSKGGAANFSGMEIWRGRYDGITESIREDDLTFFENRVRPLLATKCYACHSAESTELQGELLVDSRATIRRGGQSGPAVIPGNPDKSLLIEAVRYTNDDMQMPPDERLSDAEVADLEHWVTIGAPDPRSTATKHAGKQIDVAAAREFWSLRPIVDPSLPAVKDANWPQSEIDRFVLARLELHGLTPAGDAEPRVLIRRATYDLTGLPPTPEEVERFVRQWADSPQAVYRDLVDRLLASPRYGERWGRHWLDIVRYADTAGDNSDYPVPQMYRYRDWVIEAFNRDMPFDEFVRDQLAGDLRAGEAATDEQRHRRIIATGYLANARRFGSRVDDYPWHLTYEDTIDNLGRAFLGTSLGCTRCHDHKFDPFTTRDYYALYGIFASTRYPWPGIELDKKQRDFVPLDGKGATAYAVAETSTPADAAVQFKGDPGKPGDFVPRGFPMVLGGAQLPENCRESGRRELAEWILSRDNPLTSRVLANRIWHYHFGRGIVPTPNDFGKQGKPPTHPQLLDYLAMRLRDDGWSIKSMHRRIMLSRVYRQSGIRSSEAMAADPENLWLAGFPRQRLAAEAVRDTLLLLGSNLDLSPAEPHPFPPMDQWNFTQHKPFKAVYESNRRSVYLMTQRIQRHPMLAIFDGADPSTSTAARMTSTTPLQALYLLNDPLVHDQSERISERIVAASTDIDDRIGFAYELLFARPAEPDERLVAHDFLFDAGRVLRNAGVSADQVEAETWQAYTRTLLRLNEFVYVE
ncbi:MAG: PSD1 and planctomycete cytochrome C domain-containing protein [Pirellulaceae bacterium]